MTRETLNAMLDAVRRMESDERIAFADEVDRLAWRDRVQWLLDHIGETTRREGNSPTDAEIDAIVDEVRADKSLDTLDRFPNAVIYGLDPFGFG